MPSVPPEAEDGVASRIDWGLRKVKSVSRERARETRSWQQVSRLFNVR